MRTSALLLTLTLLSLTGCGESGPSLTSVSGKVTVDDVPWTKGAVRFVPDKSKGNTGINEATGTIGADGSYTLSTVNKSGAPTGWYKVSVSSGEIPDSANANAAKTAFPARYGDPEKSGFLIEVVKSAAPGAYDLKIVSK